MKIESVTIRGFRCFDDAGETIRFDDLTCFIGPNASGKTTAMIALARLFGESPEQRQIVPADFHLAPDDELKAQSPRTLSIECRLAFPELETEAVSAVAVPETFNQMIVDEPGGTPYCRIRLDATWTDTGTPTGDVEQSISWILTSSDDPAIIENGNRHRVQPGDRAKVRVVYVPATREPDRQIRATTATIFGRLLDALAWEDAEASLKGKLMAVQDELGVIPGILAINAQIEKSWKAFYDGQAARNVTFQVLEEDPTGLVKLLVPRFRPGEAGRPMEIANLSDGMRSLFSLSLSLGLFRLEELLRTTAVTSGFKAEVTERLPLLTIFSVEEPENHLSPQYLGRIIAELGLISASDQAQVILSSHSPSLLRRIQPDNVRYFLGHELTASTHVKPIPLPDQETDEAFKYVREGVRGFPELYFARLVILGEGPSEEIVLRRLFEASGTPLDTHFISVVPLGGRHVNHFWRLLHGLGIPYLTLLDLDREKEGGGWGRVQYVRDQLVSLHGAGHQALRFEAEGGDTGSFDAPEWDELSNKPVTDVEEMQPWLTLFADQFGVFFSAPLDLDFSMLEAFPASYKGLAPPPQGPRMPVAGSAGYATAVTQRLRQVLGPELTAAPATLGSTYTSAERQLFPWYKYLFVDRSKPVAHMRALLSLEDVSLVTDAPGTLKDLIARASSLVAPNAGDA